MGGCKPALRWIGRLLLCVALGGAVAGCGGTRMVRRQSGRGFYHAVQPGETLYRIGKAYGVSYRRLADVNGIKDPSHISVGQRLLIPGARRDIPVDVIAPRDESPRRAQADPHLPVAQRPFTWPIHAGVLSSRFGPRGRSFHDGIDIAADVGTPVLAAADGTVVYADELRGYGRVIILHHAEGYATVYAHNRENRVREGERVRRGEEIATVGDSGRTSAPNLHFEVRKDNTARNPLFYLPPADGSIQVAATR